MYIQDPPLGEYTTARLAAPSVSPAKHGAGVSALPELGSPPSPHREHSAAQLPHWEPAPLSSQFTQADRIVLAALTSTSTLPLEDASTLSAPETQAALAKLAALKDPKAKQFEAPIFTTWDNAELVERFGFSQSLIDGYVRWAQEKVVRKPADVVFLTHSLIYLLTIPTSAAILMARKDFSWTHAVGHMIYAMWSAGPFTLMLHNHIHQNGLLKRTPKLTLVDQIVPYVLCPFMGHTWNTYFYHHKQMHHVESNGPSDLSSTIRYQRDSLFHFMCYLFRFCFLIWLELPRYFFVTRKNRKMAIRAALGEISTYALYASMYMWMGKRAVVVFIVPFVLLRIGLMIGNFGQHALVDEFDPISDFRSSITLLDVASNRFSFNDGYHTSHHLNPMRHWRDHPHHFLSSQQAYSSHQALTFYDIDYLFVTVRLLMKDYEYLAKRLVPMSKEQKLMGMQERVELLKRKTKAFSEEDIQRLFGKAATVEKKH